MSYSSPFRALSAAALLALSGGAASCSGLGHDCSRDDSRDLLQFVPVQNPLPAAAGEESYNQSYSLDPESGEFTFHKSISTEVGEIGAEFRPLDKKAAERFGLEPHSGVLVRKVKSKGPASAAGLETDDVILTFGGKETTSVDRLEYLVENSKPGERVAMEIRRKDKNIQLSAEVGSEKRVTRAEGLHRKLSILDDRDRTGLRLAELTDDVRGLVLAAGPAKQGLFVASVQPGGPAFFAGVHPRDLLVQVDGQPVETLADYTRVLGAHEGGKKARLSLEREGQGIEAQVPLEEDALAGARFNFLELVKYEHRPARREFSLIFGWLYDYDACFCVRKRGAGAENVSDRRFGMLPLDLISFHFRSPGKKEVRLAWILPITWGKSDG
jgi:hypothetical protein